MASHLVCVVLSMLILLLLISFKAGVAEAKRNISQERRLESPLPPTAPMYLPPSRSRRGKGP
ncbi:hypothetical protein N665_0165s0058 [Sinapis alba]|nr:hypothetical protein N665_0165s0058 [Sinapis alba]